VLLLGLTHHNERNHAMKTVPARVKGAAVAVATLGFLSAALAGCAAGTDPNIATCRRELTAVLSGTGPKAWPDACLALDDETRDDVSEEVLGSVLGAPVEAEDEDAD
jgi:hypothetical protein